MDRTELVMRDLENTLTALDSARESPVEVRRGFGTLLTLSQQLTAMMRTEFKQVTGKKWQADAFPGWNPTTKLFKLLRNAGLHDAPIEIALRQAHRFPIGSFGTGREIALEVRGDISLDDPFLQTVPSPVSMDVATDPTKPPQPLPLIGFTNAFVLRPSTKALKEAVAAAGSSDLHVLSRRCVETLREYYQWYKTRIASSGGAS